MSDCCGEALQHRNQQMFGVALALGAALTLLVTHGVAYALLLLVTVTVIGFAFGDR